MDPALQRFLDGLDLDRDRLAAGLEAVIEALEWEDPLGDITGMKPADLLLCSTFGETVAEAREVPVGRFTMRYPGPGQHRAASLHLVDAMNGLQATLDHVVRELVPIDEELARDLALAGARASQPDGRFRWDRQVLCQEYEVVEVVERWPGQIALEAARRHDPALGVGDGVWLEDREALPVCWVLDALRR